MNKYCCSVENFFGDLIMIEMKPVEISLTIHPQGHTITVEGNDRLVLKEAWKLIKSKHKQLPRQIRNSVVYSSYYGIEIKYGIDNILFTHESLDLFATPLINSNLFMINDDNSNSNKMLLIANYNLVIWLRLPWYSRLFKSFNQKLLS